MARNRRTSRGRRSSGSASFATVLGTVVFGLLAASMLGGFVWAKYGRQQEVALDNLNCPVTGATSMTAIVVDATDPISEITMDNLRNEFRREVGKVEKGGYLRIASLTGTPRELPTLFDGCNPGDGSTVDEWTNNPTRRQRRWEETFGIPLEQLPKSIPNGRSADQSPIMAAIQKIRLDLFDSDIAKADAPKRIIVVSDMIEHTDIYSQYRLGIGYDDYLNSDARRTYSTDLSGIVVQVLYIERVAKKFSFRDHGEFWATWIVNNGGNYVPIKLLEGLN